METPEDDTSEPQFELTVNEELWKPVAHLDHFGSGDRVYSFDRETGTVRFGNGTRGERPPVGARIHASYRYGAGAEGDVNSGPTISLTWTSNSFHRDDFIGAIIESQANGIVFRPYREPDVPHGRTWIAILCRNIKKWALRLICRNGSRR